MKNELYLEGFFGSTEENSIVESIKDISNESQKIGNIQIVKTLPRTGENQNSYIFFSGLCLILFYLLIFRLYGKRTS